MAILERNVQRINSRRHRVYDMVQKQRNQVFPKNLVSAIITLICQPVLTASFRTGPAATQPSMSKEERS